MTSSTHFKGQPPGAVDLLEMLEEAPDNSMIGFEVARSGTKLHVGSVPDDSRSASAGLFGIRAPSTWCGIGVRVTGAARRLDTGHKMGRATSAVSLTRAGGLASYVDFEGERQELDGETPVGMLVDALHRVLGLAVPGDPPERVQLVISLWLEDVMRKVLDRGSISWAETVRCHPLVNEPVVTPSSEMIVESTFRAAEVVDWQRIWRRTLRGRMSPGPLTTREVRWMGPTMYARWALGSFPHAVEVWETMSSLGSTHAADSMLNEIAAIYERMELEQAA